MADYDAPDILVLNQAPLEREELTLDHTTASRREA